jgi:integrase
MQHGVDRSVIAMWLGHGSMDTTQMYLHANIELKERALATDLRVEGNLPSGLHIGQGLGNR